MRNCKNTILEWNPETGEVNLCRVGDWKARLGFYTSLACYAEFQNASFEKRKAMLFIEFAHIVVRDGIDPQKLNNLLMELEEWRDGCACDMPGKPPSAF